MTASPGWWGLRVAVALIYAFILAPIVVVLVASVSKTPFLTFPPAGFTLQWFQQIVTLGQFTDALRFSVTVGILATALSMILGLWIALALTRVEIPGRPALQSFFLSPIILPELALAIGLLQYFSRLGFIRGTLAVVIAHSVICTPYVIRTLLAASARLERSLEESALSLGARPWRALFDITLPLLRPGLISGGIMAFIISFDNVTISLFLAAPGNITLPALLYNQAAESGLNTTLAAVCALLVLCMFGVMLLVERVIGLEQFFANVAAHK
jgi:putative spermidine/putrescine transport system permease protein